MTDSIRNRGKNLAEAIIEWPREIVGAMRLTPRSSPHRIIPALLAGAFLAWLHGFTVAFIVSGAYFLAVIAGLIIVHFVDYLRPIAWREMPLAAATVLCLWTGYAVTWLLLS